MKKINLNLKKWEKENEDELVEAYALYLSDIERGEYDSSISATMKDVVGYWNWAKQQHKLAIEDYIDALEKYAKYVNEYAEDHEIKGNYPACLNEWFDNEYAE